MSGQDRTKTDNPQAAANIGRLESWKEIAAYFGRTERTVRRWEAQLGLPVRRMPGQQRSRVYAEVADLETWRRGASGAAAASDMEPPLAPTSLLPEPPIAAGVESKRSQRIGLAPALALASLAAIAAMLLFGLPRHDPAGRPAAAVSHPPLAAQRLYIAGMDDWAARTPASLERAVDEFRAAIARYPRYPEAYAGLAQTYDLLREYTRMPQSQAYALAREAARRAVALDDRLSSAHAALAFADYFGFWDAAAGKAHFERAIALDPANATARHWYATFLLEQGRLGEALSQIDAARELEPRSAAIAADRAFIINSLGRSGQAEAILRVLEKKQPEFKSPHAYLSVIAFEHGRLGEFLDEAQAAARLGGDVAEVAELDAARRALDSGGRAAMVAAILGSEKARYQTGDQDAYSVARWAALAGERADALHFLGLSVDRREAEFVQAPADEAFASLRSDPAFRDLIARLSAPPI